MHKDNKIYVAGHNGMVGSAICRVLRKKKYRNILVANHCDLSLDKEDQVEQFFSQNKIDYVFLAAAKVGGILANKTQGADFIKENLKIQTNVIDIAYKFGIKKLIFLGSSCIYPRNSKQPIKEEYLLSGYLEETNLPYAVAKIAGKVMCDAYKSQFGFNTLTVMPSNVYGEGDNFHPENSHVVAGLMRKFHEAKVNNLKEVYVWGTGTPLRELIYVDDLADACVFLMENYDKGGLINVGSSFEISIKELALLISKIVGFKGEIKFDSSKPDGTPRKIMDNKLINQLGWKSNTNINNGLLKMYKWWIKEIV
tara:strand:- start:118 stop:1047 length:930 start_codon:yes stop_codon:yes gene_type:complete